MSEESKQESAPPGSLHPVVGHPGKFKVGDKVSVPCRFGEMGTVMELKDGRYGVEFRDLNCRLWYSEWELRPQVGPGFTWNRK